MESPYSFTIHDYHDHMKAIQDTRLYNDVRALLANKDYHKIDSMTASGEIFKFMAMKNGQLVEVEFPLDIFTGMRSDIISFATLDHWSEIRKQNPDTLDPEDPMYLSGIRVMKGEDGKNIWYMAEEFVSEEIKKSRVNRS